MASTALLIAEVCCNLIKQDQSVGNNIGILLAMSDKNLGRPGALLSGAVYIFIHYALLVAYIAEAGDVFTDVVGLLQYTGPLFFTSIV